MSDPFDTYRTLGESIARMQQSVDEVTAGLSEYERQRAVFALVSALGLTIDMWIEKGDPAAPAFTDWMENGRKTAGDSPYTVYLSTPVDSRHVYRVWGNLGQATYFGMQLYRQQQGFNATSGRLSPEELQADSDGNFEVILSAERPANEANWFPLAKDDYVLMTREYRYDPVQQRPVVVQIERIDHEPAEPVALETRVRKAASFLVSSVLSTIEIAQMLSVNEFSPPTAEVRTPKYGDSLFPTKDTFYDGFFVRLEPGQAVELTGRLPETWRYVSFVFYDRWYATLDYPETRCYLTAKDLRFEPDGSYRIYISPEDPGHPNWIQMGSLYEGLFSYRYMLADSNPHPTVRIVEVARP